jgi:hypothetical protein
MEEELAPMIWIISRKQCDLQIPSKCPAFIVPELPYWILAIEADRSTAIINHLSNSNNNIPTGSSLRVFS